MLDLEAVLRAIRTASSLLNQYDDELAAAIALVESTLCDLKLGVPTDSTYPGEDGAEHWLCFKKHNGTWRIMHAYTENGPETPLSSAARQVRAQVFVPIKGTSPNLDPDETPIERLILDVADAVSGYAAERTFSLTYARRLVHAIEALPPIETVH